MLRTAIAATTVLGIALASAAELADCKVEGMLLAVGEWSCSQHSWDPDAGTYTISAYEDRLEATKGGMAHYLKEAEGERLVNTVEFTPTGMRYRRPAGQDGEWTTTHHDIVVACGGPDRHGFFIIETKGVVDREGLHAFTRSTLHMSEEAVRNTYEISLDGETFEWQAGLVCTRRRQ